MDLLQMVKAAKSATYDFGTFWTELYKITTKLPEVFNTFGKWDTDRLGLAEKDSEKYKQNTKGVFDGIKAARQSK